MRNGGKEDRSDEYSGLERSGVVHVRSDSHESPGSEDGRESEVLDCARRTLIRSLAGSWSLVSPLCIAEPLGLMDNVS